MKKLIAILVVMIVMVGAAFADTAPAVNTTETHVITVNTSVDLIVPVFNFKTAAAQTNTSTKFNESSTNPDFKTEDTTVLRGANDQDISQVDISQEFEIRSMTQANYTRAFDFTVEATAFTAKDPTDSTQVIYTTTTTPTYVYAKNTADLSADHIAVSDSTSKITATFSGRQFSTNVLLGKVTVTWPQDVNAKPGDYKADVTLTVTAK